MFANRIGNLAESPVRQILKVIDRPGMISFAGGLPAAECFPCFDYTTLSASHLQYGPSEGEDKLREQVATLLGKRGLQGCSRSGDDTIRFTAGDRFSGQAIH